MALLLKTDGTTQQVTPTSGATFTLQELQGFVGDLTCGDGFLQLLVL